MSCAVLTRKEKQAIYGRLIDFMRKNGGLTRQQLLTKLSSVNFPLTSQALSAYAAGRSAPNAETLIGLKKVLGISADFILTGEEPPPPSIAELIEIVNKSAIAHGHPVQPLDALTEEIMNYLLTADESKRKLLVDIVRNLKGKE